MFFWIQIRQKSNRDIENTFLIDMSCGPIRQEAGPGERQAIVRQSKLLDTLQVLPPQLVAVTAHISILIPKHSAFFVTKCVPDTRSLAVCLPATSVHTNRLSHFIKVCRMLTLKTKKSNVSVGTFSVSVDLTKFITVTTSSAVI